MVTTRASSRKAPAESVQENSSDLDDLGASPTQFLTSGQRQHSHEAATVGERDLLQELGIHERPSPKGLQGLTRCAVAATQHAAVRRRGSIDVTLSILHAELQQHPVHESQMHIWWCALACDSTQETCRSQFVDLATSVRVARLQSCAVAM